MQRTLTFSRDERILLIAAAALPTSRVHSRRLKALLYHLETTSGREGCFPAQETLAAKMGVTDRTIRNMIRLATELGLLTTDRRGRRQLSYYVAWPALRQFCTAADLAAIDDAVAVDDKGRKARALARTIRARNAAESPDIFSGVDENFPVTSGNHFRSEPETISGLPIRDHFKPPTEAGGGEWESIEAETFAAGVDGAAKAIAAARAAGVSLEEIRAALAYFRGLAGVGPAALFCKIARMRPGEPVDRRWPRSEPSANPAAWKRQAIEQSRRVDDEQIAAAAEKAATKAAAATIGEQIAELADDEKTALRERLFARLPFLRDRWRRNHADGLVAECLFDQFRREEAATV